MKVPREKGYTIPQMFDAAVAGDLKAMYIFGEDVAQTDPNTAHVVAALENLEFMVCQDIFETETTQVRGRDPAGVESSSRSTGTFTNAERRVQLVDAAIEPPGGAQDRLRDHHARSAARSGHEMGWETPEDAMDEVARADAALEPASPTSASAARACSGRSRPTAPTRRSSTSTEFELPGGKAHFAALPYKAPGDAADEEFPLILVTGRRLQHYNAGTMTRRTGNLELNDRDYLEIHPDDAERLWISDGDMISVRSKQGRTEIMAQVTDRIERGHVFTTFHFPETRTNLLIGSSRRRQHLLPRVQGDRGRRAADRRGGDDDAGARECMS